MKANGFRVLAVAMLGLGLPLLSASAFAGSSTAEWPAAMSTACSEQGGRLERAWIYNDQGVQWGEILSCSTGLGYITCQESVCRGGHWSRAEGATPSVGQRADNDIVQFPAEPLAIADALAALAGK